MNAKQQKASAMNSRLNYLIDSGLSPEGIKELMSGFLITVKFIRNIKAKRTRYQTFTDKPFLCVDSMNTKNDAISYRERLPDNI